LFCSVVHAIVLTTDSTLNLNAIALSIFLSDSQIVMQLVTKKKRFNFTLLSVLIPKSVRVGGETVARLGQLIAKLSTCYWWLATEDEYSYLYNTVAR
jgi:hypothetical protein